jgi:hypothetical protein
LMKKDRNPSRDMNEMMIRLKRDNGK